MRAEWSPISQEDKSFEAEEIARLKTGIPVRRHKLLIKLASHMVMGQNFKRVSLCKHKSKRPLAGDMTRFAKSCSFSTSGTSNVRLGGTRT